MIADEVRWVWQHVTSLLPASTMTQACTRLFFCGPEAAGSLDAASAAAVGAASAAAAAAAASLACCCFCTCHHDVSLVDQYPVNVLSSTQPVRWSMSTAATTVMTATTTLLVHRSCLTSLCSKCNGKLQDTLTGTTNLPISTKSQASCWQNHAA
jgi:hypothetical protein